MVSPTTYSWLYETEDGENLAVFFLGLRLGHSTYAKPSECDCHSPSPSTCGV